MNQAKRFWKNALLLSAVQILMRGIAVSFNAFVNRKIGAESMGLFTLVMSVYGFAQTLALSCVNLSAVRLTSERCAQLEGADRLSWKLAMRQVIRSICRYSLLFGAVTSVLLFFSAGWIAEHLLHDMRTHASLRVLAFTLPAISLSSALSGYFTGLRKVTKNAVVAVAEQFLKIVVTSTLLVLLSSGSVEASCLAVVGGGAAAEAWSLMLNIVLYVTDSRAPHGMSFGKRSVRQSTAFRDAAVISFPAAVGAYARQGLTTLEHLAIPAGLRKSGMTQAQALSSYGLLQGIAFPLVMFPYAVIGSFASLLIPEMSEQHTLGDREGITCLTREVYRYTALFSIGAAGIFVNYSRELGLLVYGSAEAASCTLALGFLVPFMYLDTVVDSLLKGLGEQVTVMRINILDAGSGLLLVVLLTPVMGLRGYILTMWICELGNLAASIGKLGKVTGSGIRAALRFYMYPLMTALLLSAVRWTVLRGIRPEIGIFLYVIGYLCLLLPEFRTKKRGLYQQASA